MLDPDQLYTVEQDGWDSMQGSHPVLMYLLDGYVDAGNVAKEIADQLLGECEHHVVATFDHDQLHDYRSRRPNVTFDTDAWVGIKDFELVLYGLRDAQGTPFLLLTGPEPDNQWQRARTAILQVCRDLEVSMGIHAFGMPTGTPHTRPSLITAVSRRTDLTADNPVMFGRMDFPASFSATLDVGLQEAGVDALGLAVHVPHYLAQATFSQAARAALERIVQVTGLDLPTASLQARERTNLADIDTEMADSAEVQAVVNTLEEQYDEQASQPRGPLPSAEEIGAELERFLAERNRKDEEGN